MREHKCNSQGCEAEGWEVYDYYGIFAGYWCEEHEMDAPGLWAYAEGGYAGDGTPLDEDY
jgi:hypothetical protein